MSLQILRLATAGFLAGAWLAFAYLAMGSLVVASVAVACGAGSLVMLAAWIRGGRR
jgi:hypothetical protein